MDNDRYERLSARFSHIEDLPTLPHVVIQLMEKVYQPEPNVEELADLVMTDQVLTTRMMRLVNSVFWGLNRSLTSVKEAIVYLGLREISNLIYTVSLANTFERDAPLMKRVLFWEHSFGCAICSRLIARRMGYDDEELAYLAGLLHDIGEVILALQFHEEFERVVRLVRDRQMTFYTAEEEVLGINHTDFGPWLVEKWRIPTALSDTIANHHDIEKAESGLDLVLIVRLADLICTYHSLNFGYQEEADPTAEMVAIWHKLVKRYRNLKHADMNAFLEEFDDHIQSVKQMVSQVYTVEDMIPA